MPFCGPSGKALVSATTSAEVLSALGLTYPGTTMTQTYSTATTTHSNPTATTLTDNTAGSANTTLQALSDGTTYANDVAAIRNNFADLAASNNALIVDLANTKQVLNKVIDILQAAGIAA